MNRLCLFLAPILTGLACGVIAAEEPAAFFIQGPIGVPMRVRDFTFPTSGLESGRTVNFYQCNCREGVRHGVS